MVKDIGWKLKRVVDGMHKQANKQLQKQNLTFSQLRVLVYLMRREDEKDATLKELERTFGVAQATMAGIVNRLEAKGIVESFTDPGDKRVKCLRLTEAGVSLMQVHRENVERANHELLSGFSEEEAEQLGGFLERIYENIRREEEGEE